MFEHVPCQIVRNRLDMPPGPDVTGKQIQECADRRVLMLDVGTADDNLPVFMELECHLEADTGPQRLTDRLGQGNLAL